ncbi:hypothetical protein [Histidinibacterium aquaticum]|uniref:DNA-binding protein n=1 Tax=Histidinibacterium aquaticum TaxID=2613962 RepID=A0A5J5GS25_9RHOB|nr:hypothetical protein [Histidinibacterium aquaticum]KAA9010354.1 hypothetical protein F3S47_03670 [Histidinibacterium aquaticum]
MQPLFAKAQTAARLLDMERPEFLRLGEAGSLPGPNKFGRWDVSQLLAIMRGDAIRMEEELEL